MPEVTWLNPGLARILDQVPCDLTSLLDVGCGRGIIGAICRIYRSPVRLVGIDSYAPYLEFCRSFDFYSELIMFDLLHAPLPFGDSEFQVVTCIEVLEHLPREAGERLLTELERVASKVIVTTPGVFSEQPAYDQNPYQKHASLWRVADFRQRLYEVYGVGEFVIMGRTSKFVSKVLAPWTWWFPSLSTSLLCIKGFGRERTERLPVSSV